MISCGHVRRNPLAVTKGHKGYTLIEILVVMVIVGITITFAILATGDFGSKRRVWVAGEQFLNYVKLVQQQAILETVPFGVSVSADGYQALRYQSKKFQTLPSNTLFKKQLFPTGVVAVVHVTQAKNPQIILESTGEMTPFTLQLSQVKGQHQDLAMTIKGLHNGVMIIEKIGA